MNAVLKIEDGVAWIDVSTPTHPDKVALIDESDLLLVLDGKGRWLALKAKRTFYVTRGIGGRRNRQYQMLHRLLLGLDDPSTKGDHRDGDGLNNRRANLRAATNQQNSQNGAGHRDGSSKFRGVSWDRDRNKWAAGIGVDGQRIALGRFDNEVAAAHAYDAAATKHFGEFARKNFQGAA